MKSPRPPDPYQTAAAQQNAEVGAAGAQAIIGNPNTYSPYGSQTYSIAGWEKVPGANGQMISVPRYNMTQKLSPDQQKLMGQQTQMSWNLNQTGIEQSAKLRGLLGKSVDTKGLQNWNAGPAAGKLATSFGGNNPMQMHIGGGGPIQKSIANQNVRQDQTPTDRASVEKAIMQNYTQDTQGQNAAQDAQMAARGLAPGSAQYGNMDQARQQSRGRAVNDAFLSSGQESRQAQEAYNQAAGQRFSQGAQMGQFANEAQNQQFMQGAAQGEFANSAQQQAYMQAMQRAGFSNDAISQMFAMSGQAADRQNALRGTQLQERLALRNQPLNEISALMSGGQVTMPQFNPFQSQGVNAPNLMGQINSNYQNQSQQANAFNSGAFGMGSSLLGGMFGAGGMFGSDRRLKQDIVPIDGMQLAGVPLYHFRYRADPELPQVGVMADEVRPLHPDAVEEIGGFDHVNYSLLLARHAKGDLSHG